MSDRAIRYGMIVLDAAPTIVRARGGPVFFSSPDESMEYARLHDIGRWMVSGDPDGWVAAVHPGRLGQPPRQSPRGAWTSACAASRP